MVTIMNMALGLAGRNEMLYLVLIEFVSPLRCNCPVCSYTLVLLCKCKRGAVFLTLSEWMSPYHNITSFRHFYKKSQAAVLNDSDNWNVKNWKYLVHDPKVMSLKPNQFGLRVYIIHQSAWSDFSQNIPLGLLQHSLLAITSPKILIHWN